MVLFPLVLRSTILTTVLGFIASTFSIIMTIPQAMRAWQLRNNFEAFSGISILTQVFLLSNALSWFAYVIVDRDLFVALPGFINIPLAILTIVLVVRGRRRGGPTRPPEDGLNPTEPNGTN